MLSKLLVAMCLIAVVAADCGVYEKAATFKRKGNKQDYECVWIEKADLSEPSKFQKDEKSADVAMTKAMACKFNALRTAAKAAGVDINIASGFRSRARQQYFWDCYQCGVKNPKNKSKCCNSGNLAAAVGSSNHGDGSALDLNTDCGNQGPAKNPWANPSKKCNESKVYKWLLQNGTKFGFVRTVQSEPWHWALSSAKEQPKWAQLK